MNLMPENLPDDPVLLKQMLLEALSRQQVTAEAYQTHIVDLKEQIKLLRDRLFGRKSEQTVEPNTPQLALFNEPESEPMTLGDADEEVVAPTPRRGKRKPLSADLPRIEVIHELPEYELTCACGCRKHVISEETSEQLDIVPMQIRAIKHVRKVYDCRGCETAPLFPLIAKWSYAPCYFQSAYFLPVARASRLSACDRIRFKSFVNHKLFADVNGANYVCSFMLRREGMNPYLRKIEIIQAALGADEWVFWLDDDAYFTDFSWRLIPYIERFAKFDFVICKSPVNQGAWTFVSSGQFFLKSTRRSAQFLDAVRNVRHGGRVIVRGAGGGIGLRTGHHQVGSPLRLGELPGRDRLRAAKVGKVRVVPVPATELV
jgi:hypothetical protein